MEVAATAPLRLSFMSHVKAASRPHQSTDSDSFKWRSQARQLQELFPEWSNDGSYVLCFLYTRLIFLSKDIQSLLVEVAGDVEQAVTRITEGSPSPFLSWEIFSDCPSQVLLNNGLSPAKRTRSIFPPRIPRRSRPLSVAILVVEEVVVVVVVAG